MKSLEFRDDLTFECDGLPMQCGIYRPKSKRFLGAASVDRIDRTTNTIYFSSPIPQETRVGDFVVMEVKHGEDSAR